MQVTQLRALLEKVPALSPLWPSYTDVFQTKLRQGREVVLTFSKVLFPFGLTLEGLRLHWTRCESSEKKQRMFYDASLALLETWKQASYSKPLPQWSRPDACCGIQTAPGSLEPRRP